MTARVTPQKQKCIACPTVFLVGGTGNKKRGTQTCSWQCRDKVRWVRKGKTCQTLTMEQSAYLAGMLDADGSVGLHYHSGKVPRVTINISNTDKAFLEWVKEVTGVGSVNRCRAETPTTKANYQWNNMSHAAATFLEQLLPYMRIKKTRAELALEYHHFLETPEGRLNTAKQEEYRTRMTALNRRGPVVNH